MANSDSHIRRAPKDGGGGIPKVPGTGALPMHYMSKLGDEGLLTAPQRDGRPSTENKISNNQGKTY